MNTTAFLIVLAETICGFVSAQSVNQSAEEPAPVTELARRLENANVFALQIRQILTKSEAPSAGNNLSVEPFSAENESRNLESSVASRDGRANDGRNKIETSNEIIYEENTSQDILLRPEKLAWNNCFDLNYASELYDDNFDYKTIKHYNDAPSKRDATDKNVNTKMKERSQSKIETNTGSAVPAIPITTEILDIEANDLNVKVDLALTENYPKDIWYGKQDKSDIRFSDLPQRENYLIPTLKLEEGFYPFRVMTEYFKFIYPFDFPVDLIKDIVWGKFSFPYSFIQSIKVESTFLGSIIVFVCLALIIPAYLLCLVLMTLCAETEENDDMETGTLFPEEEKEDCKRRLHSVSTWIVILLCCVCIAGMTISNEQASEAVHVSQTAVRCACSDIANWITAAARDIHESLLPPMDLVAEAYKEDLRNVVPLLGDPIQKTIASESGIDLVLDSLSDITSESEDLSTKISALRDASMRGGALASAVVDRLRDLGRQLDNLKKQCTGKDMPLCDTINTHSLELLIKFDLILHEYNLLELRSLGVDNLTSAIATSRREFMTLPSIVTKQTASVREDIFRDIEVRRNMIEKSVRILSDIVRHLSTELRVATRRFESGLQRLQEYDTWRWSIMLGCITMCSIVMLLIVGGVLCGCGNTKIHAIRTLRVSTVWIFITSIVVWTLVAVTYLIAGHAEVYVCHALWDAPQYRAISALLDRSSPMSPGGEGVFDILFRELENVTVDISVKDVLRKCENDQPAYDVFQLERILDVNKESSYFEWKELQADLTKINSVLDVDFLGTISSDLSKILQEMLRKSDVDLARYRLEYNGAMVGRDLPSLVEQIQTVAAQLTDLTTSSRLETLASRTQRLHLTSVKPLEQLRADVVYKLTELELQLAPFRRKLNISLSHIHTAQYYIDNQGDVIARKKISIYTSRLVSHVEGWRTHALHTVLNKAARCHPLFAVYSGARSLLCTRYVASLHGWWVCAFLLALLWCVCTPLCVSMWRSYAEMKPNNNLSLSNMGIGQQETPTTIICDTSNWNDPGPPPPPQSDTW